MRARDIVTELRRQPDLNPRVSANEILEPLSRDPRVFVSYTRLPKLGINPNPSSINTPAAVYAYPLADIWHDIRKDMRNVPFAGSGNYVYVFRYDDAILDVSEFSQSDFRNAMKKLQGLLGMLKPLPYNEPDGPGYVRPFSAFLNYTRDLALKKRKVNDVDVAGPKDSLGRKRPSSYAFTWNEMLRRSTGYDAFLDPGLGIIHGGEPIQAFFLLPTKLKVIDRIDLKPMESVMRVQEFVTSPSMLAEGMASRIDQWIEDTLARITGEPRDWDKMTDRLRSRVNRAAAAAPTEPIARELIDKILADQRTQRDMERLAWQQKTTVGKIKAMIYTFGGKFVARAMAKWQNMSAQQRRELAANTVKALLELVLIILRALAKSRR